MSDSIMAEIVRARGTNPTAYGACECHVSAAVHRRLMDQAVMTFKPTDRIAREYREGALGVIGSMEFYLNPEVEHFEFRPLR